MAMTKKERSEFDAVLAEARLLGALRWTSEVLPDVPIPKGSDMSVGWATCYDRVEPACSSSVFHAIGRTDKTSSQRPMQLYSTNLLALKALRHEVELRCANELARIDALIAEASKP